MNCNNISNSEYRELQNEPNDIPFFCLNCMEIMFPFGSVDNEELFNLNNFDFPSIVDSALSFEIVSGFISLPNFGDYDIDQHLPSNGNSSFHTLQDLSMLHILDHDLSLFLLNIRSLSLNLDERCSTLATLKINFGAIGV